MCEDSVSGDEMVQVGDFWIDRYEASVWSDPDCIGIQYGISDGDADAAGFDYNGNWSTPIYACSVEGEDPSRWLTWFQAQQSCELAGKSLCTNAQWQAAAMGTEEWPCNTEYVCDGDDPWPAGAAQCGYPCESNWGAADMVGNLWEWVAEWHQAGVVDTSFVAGQEYSPWGGYYGDDSTWNLNGSASATGGSNYVDGLPAATLRGGHWSNGTDAGIYSYYLDYAPSNWRDTIGVRCCMQD
jgi:formylglycine-generating enzyme required for sulfatase activity